MRDASHPSDVSVFEVGPRDGLQNEKHVVATADKVKFIEGLVQSGLKRIEVTAFVNPKWIPPLADQAEVAKTLPESPGVAYVALVPNLRGYENARRAGIKEVSIVLAASESHNEKNINASTSAALDRYVEVAKRCNEDKVPFRAYVSCAFGCPYEGDVSTAAVLDVAKRLHSLGAYEISLGDTIGVAVPTQVSSLLADIKNELPLSVIALHLHDTRGTALSNVIAGLDAGVRVFDSSAGGLGGCPYAPGASGNLATEDLVYALDKMGMKTGIDFDQLCATSRRMEALLGRQLPSKALAAWAGAAT